MLQRLYIPLLLALTLAPSAFAQIDDENHPRIEEYDHNALPAVGFESIMADAVDDYQYDYDSLLVDLGEWQKSSFVTVSTIGNSVQGRPLWQLSITSPANLIVPRKVVAIHVRTHPN